MRFNISSFASALLYSLVNVLGILTRSALSVYRVGTNIIAIISFIICLGFALALGFLRN